jgi:hypothetical protein
MSADTINRIFGIGCAISANMNNTPGIKWVTPPTQNPSISQKVLRAIRLPKFSFPPPLVPPSTPPSPPPPSTPSGTDRGCAASAPHPWYHSHPPCGRPPVTVCPPLLLDAATVPNFDFFLDAALLPPSSSMPRCSCRPYPVHSSSVLPHPRSSILLHGEPPTPCHFGSQMESSAEIGITIQICLDSPLQAPQSADAILNGCS